jgi:septation ring formation regulator EzrA
LIRSNEKFQDSKQKLKSENTTLKKQIESLKSQILVAESQAETKQKVNSIITVDQDSHRVPGA